MTQLKPIPVTPLGFVTEINGAGRQPDRQPTSLQCVWEGGLVETPTLLNEPVQGANWELLSTQHRPWPGTALSF